MSASDPTQHLLDALPDLPRDDDGPVFAEPWQAQAFAMTLALHEAGRFTWAEWVEVFSDEIKRAGSAGDPDRGDTYYHHWLNALEQITADKGLAPTPLRDDVRVAWDEAAHATPHGLPIALRPDILDRIRRA